MIPETQAQPTRDERMREVRAVAFGAALPYVDDGVVLEPAVKSACDLIPSVQARGLRGFLADMTVDEVVACLYWMKRKIRRKLCEFGAYQMSVER